jgi:multiphosphoryl transfer protein
VMFPMVTTVAEIRDARSVLEEAAGLAGLPEGLRVGIMVEVPAAALKIATFLPCLDFISIGTNDLTQYTLAAERGNAAVAALSDPLDPGVLRLIRHVCHTAGVRIPVAVCGETATDHTAIPVLLGLGIRELSVSPKSVPSVKARARALDLARCASLADTAIDLDDANSVRRLVSSSLHDELTPVLATLRQALDADLHVTNLSRAEPRTIPRANLRTETDRPRVDPCLPMGSISTHQAGVLTGTSRCPKRS